MEIEFSQMERFPQASGQNPTNAQHEHRLKSRDKIEKTVLSHAKVTRYIRIVNFQNGCDAAKTAFCH